jgi:hypothetical protein
MNWGTLRDRIVEGRWGTTRCWILLNREERVLSIYIKIDEVSKFLPADEFEETLDGAKLRAEIEIERFFEADRLAKLNLKK